MSRVVKIDNRRVKSLDDLPDEYLGITKTGTNSLRLEYAIQGSEIESDWIP